MKVKLLMSQKFPTHSNQIKNGHPEDSWTEQKQQQQKLKTGHTEPTSLQDKEGLCTIIMTLLIGSDILELQIILFLEQRECQA